MSMLFKASAKCLISLMMWYILSCNIRKKARNGMEAFEYVKARIHNNRCSKCKNYNLVLMDINMPILDGINATIKIREYEKANNSSISPIIALTAAETEKSLIREQHLTLGFDKLCGKPISKKTFVEFAEKYNLF